MSERTKHNALLDCELLRKVYINLIGEKEPTLVFNETNTSDFLKDKKNNKIQYSKTIIRPSTEENSSHSIFLKNELKKNYF